MVTQKYMVDNQIITLKDNLFHPYFSLISISKDNVSPLGICKMEMPYLPQALDYWMKYDDIVVISFSVEQTNDETYLNSLESKSKIKNDEYNYSFIGKINKVKHKGNKVIIYLEDIGWKFEQKVPTDFRKMYVAGQHLDDVFQAICEFIDVRFCYSIKHLNEYTFGDDGYSIQKDGNTIEEFQDPFELIKNDTLDSVDTLDNPYHENEGLLDYDNNNNNNNQENILNNIQNNLQNNNKTQFQTQNDDSKKQEEGLTKKIKKHEEDFKQKIQDLFVGNKYYDSNIASTILNYGGITLDTKDTTNESIDPLSNVNNENQGNDGHGTANQNSNNNQNSGKTNSGSNKGSTSSKKYIADPNARKYKNDKKVNAKQKLNQYSQMSLADKIKVWQRGYI